MADERVPPQAVADEAQALSEVLDSQVALKAALASGLEPEHFYLDRHALIFRAMRKVAADGGHPDEPTTWEALKAMGLALPADANGAEEGVRHHELLDLTAKSVNPYRVGQIADRVVEKARLRAKLTGAQKIQEGVYEEEETQRADLFHEGLELIVSNLSSSTEPTTAAEVADEYVRYQTDPAPDEVFALPFAELNDCILGGHRRKEVSAFAAHSEHGKSWLVDQMLHGFSRQGYRSVLFATEMDWLLRTTRFIATQTAIPMGKLLRKELSDTELGQMKEALKALPYDQHNAAGWHENEICERIILGGYDVAVVDVVNYLPEYVEKVQYAERICQRFLATAQRGNCHIILVSHFNRERDKDKVKPRPVKRDLKHTSALEQIASSILFLHRDQNDGGEVEPGGELFWAKTRTGMGGSIRVCQNSRFLTFQQEARDEAPSDFFDRNRVA